MVQRVSVGVNWRSNDARLVRSQRRIRRNQNRINRAFSRFNSQLLGFAGGLLAFGAITAQLNTIREQFDEINKQSRELNLTAQNTLELRSAFEQAGISGERVVRALGRINAFGAELREGRLTSSLTRGLDNTLLNLFTTGASVEAILERFGELTPDQATTAARVLGIRGAEQFGRASRELVEGMRRIQGLFRDLGITLRQSTLERLEAFNDGLNRAANVLRVTFFEEVFGGGNATGQDVADRFDELIRTSARILRATIRFGRLILNAIRSIPLTIEGALTGIALRLAATVIAPFIALTRGIRTLIRTFTRVVQQAFSFTLTGVTGGRALVLNTGVALSVLVTRLINRLFRQDGIINKRLSDFLRFSVIAPFAEFLLKLIGQVSNWAKGFTRLNRLIAVIVGFFTTNTLGRVLTDIGVFLSRVGIGAVRLIGFIFVAIGRIVTFIQKGSFLRRTVAYLAIGEVLNRTWDNIISFISTIFGALDRFTFGLGDFVADQYERIRQAFNRAFANPDPNNNQGIVDNLLNPTDRRASFLQAYNAQFEQAERTAVSYAQTVKSIGDGVATDFNNLLFDMTKGLADGSADIRQLWQDLLNNLIKSIQDALFLDPLKEITNAIGSTIGQGILGGLGVIPDAPEVAQQGLRTTPQGAGIVQNITINSGVTTEQVLDITTSFADSTRRSFAREAGQAGTQVRRSIQGAQRR